MQSSNIRKLRSIVPKIFVFDTPASDSVLTREKQMYCTSLASQYVP